tara:strand:- start:47730 stop:47912 length:183 start_codon:yes stop_codon:yes gene_type:complete
VPLLTDRFVGIRDVARRTALSRTTIARSVKAGSFPTPVRFSPTCLGWYESEIDTWIAEAR